MRQNILDRNKARTANSVNFSIASEVEYRRSVLLRNFVLNGQVSASNPLLHIHADRPLWASLKNKTVFESQRAARPI
jgi:hypothetical protein